ncbi:hypothetical protein [Microbulbifer mangrovi]|uniref:hypothetical protein n=1 Tax=Microbulbifer mangrovi TaxID=927787 RepID=UPI0009906C1E|nr:hypothetical protein [Microbulbifer mangrovi]
MVPFGLTESQFVSRYRRELDRVSVSVIETLRSLFKRVINDDVHTAHIEVFLDEYGSAPSIWIYYRGENNKVDHNDESLFAGRSLDLQLHLSALANFDERYFFSLEDGDLGFPGLALAGDCIKSWFAEIWWKAGGWVYPLPTTLAVHDDWGDGNLINLAEAGH